MQGAKDMRKEAKAPECVATVEHVRQRTMPSLLPEVDMWPLLNFWLIR